MTVAVATFPSYLRITESRLTVAAPAARNRSVLTRRGTAPLYFAEMWKGGFALAPMTTAELESFLLWLYALDGRSGAFSFPMPRGIRQRDVGLDGTGSVATNAVAGATVLSVTPPVGLGTIWRGSLVAIGSITDDAYQVCQVLTSEVAGSPVSLRVAPRLRSTVAAGTPVTFGALNMRLRLANDLLDTQRNVNGSGNAVLEVMEHVV